MKWNICSKTGEFSQFLPETGAVCQMRTGSRGMFTVYKRDTSVFCLKRICKAFVCIQFHQHCPCNPQAVVLLVTLPKTGRNLPKMIFQYLRRFFCTGGFFSNFATILKLVWPEKMNLLNFEKLYFNKNKHNFPPTKTGSAHSKDTEKTNIPPVALIGGRLEIKIVFCLKLVVLRLTEVN